ncbi:MAG: hypothetical protein O3A46_03030 [Candidatus Poribacteria bacterium]|nr:hypothetical protein [Candidatus Poribacteria bacterium]
MELMAAAIIAGILLFFVLMRLLRIGCRLIFTFIYFLILAVMAIVLYSFLVRSGVF